MESYGRVINNGGDSETYLPTECEPFIPLYESESLAALSLPLVLQSLSHWQRKHTASKRLKSSDVRLKDGD